MCQAKAFCQRKYLQAIEDPRERPKIRRAREPNGSCAINHRVSGRKRVDKDNTVAIKHRSWQIDKTRFRNTLAGHFFFRGGLLWRDGGGKKGAPWLVIGY
jgi:hypothetical protein